MNIHSLATDAERAACAGIMADSEPWLTLGQTYEQGLRLLTKPDTETVVALDGETVAGFAILSMQGILAGYLQTLAVATPFRRQRVGARLMRFVEERVFRDRPNVFLFVSSFNAPAQKFYTALGYETIGVLQEFLIKGHDEILMRKTIGPLR